jgi:ribosomal protein L25 (general stress protein Ctc)
MQSTMRSIHLVARRSKSDKKGFVHCVVYGKNSRFVKNSENKNEKPYYNISLSISDEELKNLKSAGLKTRALPIEINFEDGTPQKRIAIVKAVTTHPLTDQITHIDFFLVDNIEKFETTIHIKLTGIPVGAKEGGSINHVTREIKAFRTKDSITEEIKVDISHLNKKGSIRAQEILPSDIFIEDNPVIVTIV